MKGRERVETRGLSSLSTESSSELEILGLDGNSLGVDGWRRKRRKSQLRGRREGRRERRGKRDEDSPAKLVSSKRETR